MFKGPSEYIALVQLMGIFNVRLLIKYSYLKYTPAAGFNLSQHQSYSFAKMYSRPHLQLDQARYQAFQKVQQPSIHYYSKVGQKSYFFIFLLTVKKRRQEHGQTFVLGRRLLHMSNVITLQLISDYHLPVFKFSNGQSTHSHVTMILLMKVL